MAINNEEVYKEFFIKASQGEIEVKLPSIEDARGLRRELYRYRSYLRDKDDRDYKVAECVEMTLEGRKLIGRPKETTRVEQLEKALRRNA